MDAIKKRVEESGFALIRRCISEGVVASLSNALGDDEHGARNILANPIVRALACSEDVRGQVARVLERDCFAVRGIFFNKNSKANWKVSWHQDCVIAVRKRGDVRGWGPWSCKAGIPHVRPTATVIEKMLAIRIHLDECGQDNGPLRVIPGTHSKGFLTDAQIQGWPKDSALACTAHQGDAILMRPLLLHASSQAVHLSNRRVVHLEFAAEDLPQDMEWYERVGMDVCCDFVPLRGYANSKELRSSTCRLDS